MVNQDSDRATYEMINYGREKGPDDNHKKHLGYDKHMSSWFIETHLHTKCARAMEQSVRGAAVGVAINSILNELDGWNYCAIILLIIKMGKSCEK